MIGDLDVVMDAVVPVEVVEAHHKGADDHDKQ